MPADPTSVQSKAFQPVNQPYCGDTMRLAHWYAYPVTGSRAAR
jgi:hypothetical protein